MPTPSGLSTLTSTSLSRASIQPDERPTWPTIAPSITATYDAAPRSRGEILPEDGDRVVGEGRPDHGMAVGAVSRSFRAELDAPRDRVSRRRSPTPTSYSGSS